MGKLARISNINREERGITGLETAIILIAFVIVASVFAYVVLSAGLYSAQKAKEAVNAGLQEVRSTVELKGDIIVRMDNSTVTAAYFTVGVPPAGEGIDFTDTSGGNNVVIISYNDSHQRIPSVNWTVTKLNTDTADYLLDPNELFEISVDLSCTDNVGAYSTFVLELKPPVGAILLLERTVPARVSQYVNLH